MSFGKMGGWKDEVIEGWGGGGMEWWSGGVLGDEVVA
jgi:hypothetical protein